METWNIFSSLHTGMTPGDLSSNSSTQVNYVLSGQPPKIKKLNSNSFNFDYHQTLASVGEYFSMKKDIERNMPGLVVHEEIYEFGSIKVCTIWPEATQLHWATSLRKRVKYFIKPEEFLIKKNLCSRAAIAACTHASFFFGSRQKWAGPKSTRGAKIPSLNSTIFQNIQLVQFLFCA